MNTHMPMLNSATNRKQKLVTPQGPGHAERRMVIDAPRAEDDEGRVTAVS